MTLIITVGLPGVGKSTWAREFQRDAASVIIVERDLIRKDLGIAAGDFAREGEVSGRQEGTIVTGLATADYVVAADTNLQPRYRRRLASVAEVKGRPVLYKILRDSLDLDLVLTRNEERRGDAFAYVPPDVIRRMHERLVLSGAWLQGIDRKWII